MVTRKENGIYVKYDNFELSIDNFDGTADVLKAAIDSAVEKAKKMGMVKEGTFSFEARNSYYDGLEVVVYYSFWRTENEKERAIREAAELKEKERKAKRRKIAAEKKKLKDDAEYAEFLRLKEKFKEID
jgi:hypothetical protein